MTEESLPIRADTLHEELRSMRKLLQYWEELVNTGIPGIDLPTENAEMMVERFRRELCGELTIVAGRSQALAVVVSEG
jgi:hypothetical protein